VGKGKRERGRRDKKTGEGEKGRDGCSPKISVGIRVVVSEAPSRGALRLSVAGVVLEFRPSIREVVHPWRYPNPKYSGWHTNPGCKDFTKETILAQLDLTANFIMGRIFSYAKPQNMHVEIS